MVAVKKQDTCIETVEDLVLTKMNEALTDTEIVHEISEASARVFGREVTETDYVAVIRRLVNKRDGITRA